MSEQNTDPLFELPLIRCISSLYQVLVHAFCHSNGLNFSNMTNKHNMLKQAILLDHQLFYGDLSRKTVGQMMVNLLSNATSEYMNYCYSRNIINQRHFIMTMVKFQSTEDMISATFGADGALNKELGRSLRQWLVASIQPYPGASPLTDDPNQTFTDVSSRNVVLIPDMNSVTSTTSDASNQSSMDASNDMDTLTSESSSSITQASSDDIDTTSPKVKKVSLKRRNSDLL